MTRKLNEISRGELQEALRQMGRTLNCPLSILGCYNVYDAVYNEWELSGGHKK